MFIFSMRPITLLTIFALLTVSQLASAQNQNPAPKDETEHIEVLRDRPASFYLKKMIKERKAFYGRFNDLVDDNSMEIKCSRRDPNGKLIKERFCEPRFVYEAYYGQTQRALFGSWTQRRNNLLSPSGPTAVQSTHNMKNALERKQQALTLTMAKLIKSDPDLEEKYRAYVQALIEYEKLK